MGETARHLRTEIIVRFSVTSVTCTVQQLHYLLRNEVLYRVSQEERAILREGVP